MVNGRWMLLTAALLGALGLVLSAASAHALKAYVDPSSFGRLDTANRYLTYYSLVLLAVAILYQLRPWPGLRWVAALFTAGIGIFSGSLYILCLTEIQTFARITPLGGLTLLAGWLALAWVGWRNCRVRET